MWHLTTIKNFPNLRGLGYIGHINTTDKGGATVGDQDYGTIAHELGHLFGGYHTFATKVNQVGQGIGSEPGMGQSVMSYGGGYLRDFLSLITLEQMQAPLHGADALHPVRVPLSGVQYSTRHRPQQAQGTLHCPRANLLFHHHSRQRPRAEGAILFV